MKTLILSFALLAGASMLQAGTPVSSAEKNLAPTTPTATFGGPFLERSKLTGDWGGFRDDLANHGLTLDIDGLYTFQGVANGGTKLGRSTGNLFWGGVALKLDTDKAGLWPGGFFKVRFEGRDGDNVQGRAGSISPVNNYSLVPLVPGTIGDSAYALTELNYTQLFCEQFGVSLGLMNITSGDANPIAGSMISNDGFMNPGFLYSSAETAVVPTVTLGGALIFLPSKHVHGSVIVVGSTETVGDDPFEHYQGTTFGTEWTFNYELGGRPSGMTVGGLYSINRPRADLAADARLFFANTLHTGALLTTDSDAWSIYWNGYHYLQGDEKKGWGLFARLGFGDGDVNPVRFNMAVGIGGTSPLPGRETDRWGLGLYYIDMANLSVLETLNVQHETGAELFYNIALTKWAHLSLDAQIVDSAISHADTAVVLGTRVVINF